MMNDNIRVAYFSSIPPQLATLIMKSATLPVSSKQRKEGIVLKGLAVKVLSRNQERNQHATPNMNVAQLFVCEVNDRCTPFSLYKQGGMEQEITPIKPCRKRKARWF